jgi:cell division protein FtsI/penicillin-binding protein 2
MVGMPAESRGLRLSIIGIVIFSLFVALVARLWYLQAVEKDDLAQVASANQVRTVPLPPMRGRILDRVGRVLADNDSTLNVTIDRKVIKNQSDRTALFERLAGPLKTTPRSSRSAIRVRSTRLRSPAVWPRTSTSRRRSS